MMLIDLQHVTTGLANSVVDTLCKSIEEGMADDPHPTDPLTGAMEDAATDTVERGLLSLHEAMLAMLVTGVPLQKAAPARAFWLPSETTCQHLERRVAMEIGRAHV
jgi:hypothetical protein